MTIQEYLNLPEQEQAIEAGKCFTDKPWKHNCAPHGVENHWFCTKCDKSFPAEKVVKNGKSIHYAFQKFTATTIDCPISDPITIDWNTAKRLQGEVCDTEEKKQVFDYVLVDIEEIVTGISQWDEDSKEYCWDLFSIKPIHYIAAGMAAKEWFK